MPPESEKQSAEGARVLVVEDQPDVARLIQLCLEKEGMRVQTVADGGLALKVFQKEEIDLLVLDILLPGAVDGYEVCRRLRADPTRAHMPILMLTAKTEDIDTAKGLECGADDYVKKPFSNIELVARIKALLRRTYGASDADSKANPVVTCRELSLDGRRHIATLKGEPISLTLAEFRLLYFLMAHPERAHSRQELLPHVVGPHVRVVDRNIDVHVRNIRKKIGLYADCIVTVRGIGYRFEIGGRDEASK